MENVKAVKEFMKLYTIQYLNNLESIEANELNWFKENMKKHNIKGIHIDEYQIIFKGKYNKVIEKIINN